MARAARCRAASRALDLLSPNAHGEEPPACLATRLGVPARSPARRMHQTGCSFFLRQAGCPPVDQQRRRGSTNCRGRDPSTPAKSAERLKRALLDTAPHSKRQYIIRVCSMQMSAMPACLHAFMPVCPYTYMSIHGRANQLASAISSTSWTSSRACGRPSPRTSTAVGAGGRLPKRARAGRKRQRKGASETRRPLCLAWFCRSPQKGAKRRIYETLTSSSHARTYAHVMKRQQVRNNNTIKRYIS